MAASGDTEAGMSRNSVGVCEEEVRKGNRWREAGE